MDICLGGEKSFGVLLGDACDQCGQNTIVLYFDPNDEYGSVNMCFDCNTSFFELYANEIKLDKNVEFVEVELGESSFERKKSISVLTQAHCEHCNKLKHAVFTCDTSDGEYESMYVCFECIRTVMSGYILR